MTPQDFINESLGHSYDIDGYYGTQCWDLFARYCQRLGYPIFHCTKTGYVGDIWTERKSSGILNYFDEVSIDSVKIGDVVVFKKNSVWTPYTHIGVFYDWLDNEQFVLVSQNQGGNLGVVTKCNFPKSVVMGVLRPKCYATATPKRSGIATALFNNINVRTKPSLSSTTLTGKQYNAGMKLNFSNVVEGDGWQWMEYMSYDGVLHYCALQTVDGSTVYWKVE